MIVCEESQKPTTLATEIHDLSTPALLHRIAHWDGDSPQEAGQVLATAFGAEDYPGCIGDLDGRGVDPRLYVNGLDQVSSFTIPA